MSQAGGAAGQPPSWLMSCSSYCWWLAVIEVKGGTLRLLRKDLSWSLGEAHGCITSCLDNPTASHIPGNRSGGAHHLEAHVDLGEGAFSDVSPARNACLSPASPSEQCVFSFLHPLCTVLLQVGIRSLFLCCAVLTIRCSPLPWRHHDVSTASAMIPA